MKTIWLFKYRSHHTILSFPNFLKLNTCISYKKDMHEGDILTVFLFS